MLADAPPTSGANPARPRFQEIATDMPSRCCPPAEPSGAAQLLRAHQSIMGVPGPSRAKLAWRCEGRSDDLMRCTAFQLLYKDPHE